MTLSELRARQGGKSGWLLAGMRKQMIDRAIRSVLALPCTEAGQLGTPSPALWRLGQARRLCQPASATHAS